MVASEEFRAKVIHLGTVIKGRAEGLVVNGDRLETRMVKGDEFNEVINEQGRLVIVSFDKELAYAANGRSIVFDERLRDLPPQVLLVRVQIESNTKLMKSLGLSPKPIIQVYEAGRLLREFEHPVDTDVLLAEVDNLLGPRFSYNP